MTCLDSRLTVDGEASLETGAGRLYALCRAALPDPIQPSLSQRAEAPWGWVPFRPPPRKAVILIGEERLVPSALCLIVLPRQDLFLFSYLYGNMPRKAGRRAELWGRLCENPSACGCQGRLKTLQEGEDMPV